MAVSELNESPLSEIVNEQEEMAGLEHTWQACSDKVDSSEKLQQSQSRKRIAEDVSIEERSASGVDIERTTENTEERWFSVWKVKAENLLLKIELLNQSRKGNQFQEFNNPLVHFPKKVVQAPSAQLGQRTGVLNTGSSVVASLFTCKRSSHFKFHQFECYSIFKSAYKGKSLTNMSSTSHVNFPCDLGTFPVWKFLSVLLTMSVLE